MSQKFAWGAATAAYQIEGAVNEDGRTDSIWDTYCRIPGNTAEGADGSVAADHYHRWPQDVSLMEDLRLDAYRFSIAWPRVQPGGTGPVNPAGLDFYRRLVAALQERGIRPYVTLYHWDLPQELEDRGGWANRDTAVAFGEYAALVGEALASEGVTDWFTVNEPFCTAFLGYASGVHAPGRTDPAAALAAVHHLNLAHTLGYRALQATAPGSRIGAALNMRAVYPGNPADPADLAAARKISVMGDEVFIGPMIEGRYSPEVFELTERIVNWDRLIRPGDLPDPNEPMGLIGVNYYYSITAEARRPDSPSGGTGGHGASAFSPWVGCEDVVLLDPPPPHTQMGWNIDPDGLRRILTELSVRFPGIPLSITENGLANADVVSPDGAVHDPQRINYLRDHIEVVADVRQAGAEVESYFVWSLMDNFEWARGYSKRFGLVHIDYETLVRTPKDSAKWYTRVAASGLPPEDLPAQLMADLD